jgi:hypothetical protein
MTQQIASFIFCYMDRQDFRSLRRETQEALRIRAVFLVLQLHKTQAEAAEAVGVRSSISGYGTTPVMVKRHCLTAA